MLRERQRQQRQDRVVEAAAALIRRHGGTGFSMHELAEASELAPKTLYNLFGSKSAILYELLNRSVDEVVRETLPSLSEDPVDGPLEAARRVSAVFVRDPAIMKPLYQFLLGVPDPERRPQFMARAIEFWRAVLDRSVRRGHLTERRAGQLARELLIHTVGTLDLWIHGELDDDAFRAQIAYGSTLLFLQVAPPSARRRVGKRLATLERKLSRSFASERH